MNEFPTMVNLIDITDLINFFKSIPDNLYFYLKELNNIFTSIYTLGITGLKELILIYLKGT